MNTIHLHQIAVNYAQESRTLRSEAEAAPAGSISRKLFVQSARRAERRVRELANIALRDARKAA